jgi:hypothetical protein
MMRRLVEMKIALAVFPVLIAFFSLYACSSSDSGDASSLSQVQAVAAPTFNNPGGTYTTDQSITIACPMSDATIYYTTDGSTPTTASTIYGNPIAVAGNGSTVTIRAVAVKPGMTDSPVVSATYTITYTQITATPTFTVPAGTYSTDQSVAIVCAMPDATIYYTTDGSTPTTVSPVYTGPISVAGIGTTMTIKAMAVKTGLADSPVVTATYTIVATQTVATPAFVPATGVYSADQSVTIICSTSGATIYFTTDGSPPTAASAVYTGPITVAGNGTNVTIKAMAAKPGLTDSPVASATYTIAYSQAVATPTFTPAGGTYSSNQSVTISCATSGAVIYYTTDGTAPTIASRVYGSAILVSGSRSVTIKAMATKAGLPNSPVATATYAITASSAIFSYPPSGTGGLIQSSLVFPNNSDQDMYAYDVFTLTSTQLITEVDWRGGYIHALGGPVTNFTVTIFANVAVGARPLVTNPSQEETNPVYLAKYVVGSNAGETLAGVFGGTVMYDYKFVLPTPFLAVAGTPYWLRIEAYQNSYPDWGIAVGTGGDGQYYRFSTGLAQFLFIPGGDTSFTLK